MLDLNIIDDTFIALKDAIFKNKPDLKDRIFSLIPKVRTNHELKCLLNTRRNSFEKLYGLDYFYKYVDIVNNIYSKVLDGFSTCYITYT